MTCRNYGFALALLLLVLGGCAVDRTVSPATAASAVTAANGDETPAASDEETPPQPAPQFLVEEEEGATFDATLLGEEAWKRGRLGVRIGWLLPAFQSVEDFKSSVAFGLFYQELSHRESNIIYELGLEYANTQSESGYVDSDLFFFKGDLLLAPWSRVGARWNHYWLLGVYAIAEVAHDKVADEYYYIYGGGPSLGVGFTNARKGLDFRVSCTILTGSGNAKTLIQTGTAYAF